MLKNYLKTALRNAKRQKGYTFINIVGLSIGLACSFFILLWVMNEVSYDRFHEKGDNLYRVMRTVHLGDQIYTWSSVPKPIADVLNKDYPEVAHAMPVSWQQQPLVTYGDQTFREKGYYAGPAFFQSFSFPLIMGSPADVIKSPDAIAISEKLASKLFGEDWRTKGNVLGQTLNINHRKDFRITGVFADVPQNSSFQMDLVLPMEDFIQRNDWVNDWGNSGLEIYAELKPGATGAALDPKIAGMVDKNKGMDNTTVFLQPFEDMHLYSDYRDGKLQGGRIDLIRIFGIVGIFLLLIASINFMNLATARSMQRSKEIGVRKAVGASQQSLIRQFMAESMLMAGAAFVLAMLLVVALLHSFSTLTDKHIGFLDLNPRFLLAVLGIALLTGILSGSYPALYLSAFNPVAILRGTFRQRPSAARLRKGLVVFQFALSTLLIVGTAAVFLQVHYILNRDLGLDRGNLVSTGLEGQVRDQFDAFKQQLLKQPGIVSVTASSDDPLQVGSSTTDPTWEGKDPEDNTLFHIINANYDFVETMKMHLIAGRAFSKDHSLDTANYVINERTVAALGGGSDPSSVVGKSLEFWDRKGQVIGVVKDFHMQSMEAPTEPTIIRLDPPQTNMVWVRTAPGRTKEAVAGFEAVYKQFNPGYPFEYEFMDKDFEDMYRGVIVMGKLANIFAVIAVVISCLGLFGLASFTAEQRTKEIGVRKVLGASASNLVMLLSMDFTKLVLVGFVLAAPLAYFLVNKWLEHFTYRVEIHTWMFVGAGVAALVIAWLTVSYQSIKAAVANPVDSLRSE
ncbi:MAG TPA: ABC transporter permease [Rhodothermales bacterium]|nr:ABC transporter permease [Rhodothermales bacterium]